MSLDFDDHALPPVSHDLRRSQETPPLCEAALPKMLDNRSTTPPSSSASVASVASNSLESHSSDEQPTKSMDYPTSKRLADLTSWRDVKESGVLFTSLVVTILLLMKYPVLYLLSNVMLILITGSAFVKAYAKIMSIVKSRPYEDHCSKFLKSNYVDAKQLQKHLTTIAKTVSPCLQHIQHLVLGSSLSDSVKFGLKLYALSHMTSWFTGLTLALWTVLIGFSWPIIYAKNQPIIDQNVGAAKSAFDQAYTKAVALIPKQLTDKFKKE